MKLTRIKVNGYKNLIDCEIELDSFNVLIGANNTGKSNLLEVFWFLNALLTGGDEVKESLFSGDLKDKGIFKTLCNTQNENILSLELEFVEALNSGIYKYWYFVEIELDNWKRENSGINKEYLKYKNIKSTGKPRTVFERTDEVVGKLVGQKIQKIYKAETVISLIKKISDIKDNLGLVAQKGVEILYSICKTPVVYSSPHEIKALLEKSLLYEQRTNINSGRVVALDIQNMIINILESKDSKYFQEVVCDVLNAQDISYEDLGGFKIVLVEVVQGRKVQLDQLSDGTLIALNLITYLFTNKYPIIAIEELENSLHPKLLKKLIRLMKDSFPDTQIILTTHSPTILNLVKLEDVSIVSNDENGAVRVERVKDKKDLVKKLSGTFASFGDIFYYDTEE